MKADTSIREGSPSTWLASLQRTGHSRHRLPQKGRTGCLTGQHNSRFPAHHKVEQSEGGSFGEFNEVRRTYGQIGAHIQARTTAQTFW